MSSHRRALRGLVGTVVAVTALAVAGPAHAVVVGQPSKAWSTPSRHLPAHQLQRTGATGRYLVVADRPSLARGLGSELERIPGLTVSDDRVVGRSIAVEVAPESDALDEARALDGVADVVPEVTYSVLDTPGDPAYGDQSATMNALQLPAAWGITHGSAGVTIAVVDTGVTVTHPDLAGKVTGYYNAVTGGTSPGDVTDNAPKVGGHGTFVASVAAASTNNAVGLAGAGWNSSLLAVRVANSSGVMTNQAVADGIDWAVAHGADVINISLGSEENDALTSAAVARALAADVVVVAAAGNEGVTTKTYPAALVGVVAVGATTVNGKSRATFSQYGSWVDVGAPGESIIGANADYLENAGTSDDYLIGDGTSFAAPLVAGIAGLLHSFRPEMTAAQVQAAFKASTNGKSYGFHSGVVDARALLGYQFSLPMPDVTAPVAEATVSGDLDVHVDLPGGVDADSVRATLGTAVVDQPISGGSAQLEVPTYGLDGQQTLHVVLCRSTVCSNSGRDVLVVVQNLDLTITSPAEDAVLEDDFTMSADAPGAPTVRFLYDGTDVLATDSAAPFSATIRIGALPPGEHTLQAVICSADASQCATGAPQQVHVEVDRLNPALTVAPAFFSPNGDGASDTTTFTYAIDVASHATIRVQDSLGSDVRIRDLGDLTPGTRSLAWGGKNDLGTALPAGTYTVRLETDVDVSGHPWHGLSEAVVTIDLTAPKVSGAASTYPTVFPAKDSYRDSTTLSVNSAEDTAGVAVYVYNAKGTRVWSANRTNAPAGQIGLRFTGHSGSGAQLAAGSYTYLFHVRDKAGNLSASGTHTVKVSPKKLVARTFTKTATPVGSGNGSYLHNPGDNSYVSYSSWASGALYWDAVDGPVMTIHHVTLPSATIAGNVRVSVYGRGGTGGYTELSYLAEDGETTSNPTRMGNSAGTHAGASVQVTSELLYGHQLRWVVFVDSGAWYEAKTFTITYRYQVLV